MAKIVRLALLIALLILCLLGLNYSAQAQGVRFSPTAAQTTSTVAGQTVITPLPGASISVCAYPAVGQSSITPCSNTITTYTDQTLTSTCPSNAQLVLDGTSSCVAAADAQGNFGWWAALGEYSYSVCSGGACATYWTPGFAGGVQGTFSVTNTGLYTNTQMNLYFKSLLDGINPTTEYQKFQPANFATDAFTAGAAVPLGATVHQIDGIGSYVTTAADSATRTRANASGGYFSCRVIGTNGACWGTNPIVGDTAAISGANLIGQETDINAVGTPSFIRGNIITICNTCVTGATGTVPADAIGLEIGRAGTAVWPIGLRVNRGSQQGTLGIVLDGQNTTNNTNSNAISFLSYDGGGVKSTASILSNPDGSIQLQPGSGTAVFVHPNGKLEVSGVTADGVGFKHKRVTGCTTGATSGNNCETTVTWGTAFADANYTVTCSLLGTATLGHLAAISTSVQAAASVKVQTVTDTNAAITGTINCIAIHD